MTGVAPCSAAADLENKKTHVVHMCHCCSCDVFFNTHNIGLHKMAWIENRFSIQGLKTAKVGNLCKMLQHTLVTQDLYDMTSM